MKYSVLGDVITYYDDDGNLLPFTPSGKPQKKPDPPIKTMLTPEEKADLYGRANRLAEYRMNFDALEPVPLKERVKEWFIPWIAGVVTMSIFTMAGIHIADIFFKNM